MSETFADRFRTNATTFTARLREVPDGAWESPAPCDGWVTRDVVRHLVEWVPGYLSGLGITVPTGPSVDDDPIAAWTAVADGVQAALDDPETAERTVETPQFGSVTVGQMIDMIVTGDVFVHTWDVARAAGLDHGLDQEFAAAMLAGMEPMDEVLRGEHFGPRVAVDDDADAVTRLIAFTGRTP